jgi:hypothetical protein
MTPRRSLPWCAVRALGPVLGLVVVLVASGCGGGSSGGGWTVIDKGTFAGSDPAFLHTTVGRPSKLQVQVTASPNVQSTTNYTVGCGNEGAFRHRGPAGKTPLKGAVVIPPGAPGSCFLQLSASKSKPTKMTLVLLAQTVTTT